MPIENLPEELKDIVDTVAKSGYLKVENKQIEIKLEEYNKIDIQLKNSLFGTKLKVEDDNSITPIITFDTKKLKKPQKNINIENVIDSAIENYLNEY